MNLRTILVAFVFTLYSWAAAATGANPNSTFLDLTLLREIIGLPNASTALNTTYAGSTTALTNGVLISSGGNLISYCPALSCEMSPWPDHQRTSALFWSTSGIDAQAEEQTLAVETIINKGYVTAWTTGHAYATNVNVSNGDYVYRQTAASCTSAGSGGGPTGTGSNITDNTCRWDWINDGAIAGKVGIYNEVQVQAGAGATWGMANNHQMEPGVIPSFHVGAELDFTNNAADCAIGVANCMNLDVAVKGENQSTQGIYLESTNAGPTYATIWGMRLHGDFLASNIDIEDGASGAVGLGFNASGLGGAHSAATI